MRYDFDKIVNRRGTNCYKYDEMPNDDTIALWVADMDFETAPCVLDALKKRMEHGCFGYTKVPSSFYQATIDWFSRRHGWQGIKKEWFIYTSGVVPAVSAIIKAMTQPGDKVLLHTPAYNCFFSSIRNNGCKPSPFGGDGEGGVLLLCNPHNPTGHVWSEEELTDIAERCREKG
ncbi:MAG: aminotransferase class I/II-fold pyridoxal phosphate-dependent enzyme, partial [Prevotella sp.]|nr:aminotransferase class I/II-fold pyridoxal phosphate-dependent enzyme [Prevotella sp.]